MYCTALQESVKNAEIAVSLLLYEIATGVDGSQLTSLPEIVRNPVMVTPENVDVYIAQTEVEVAQIEANK